MARGALGVWAGRPLALRRLVLPLPRLAPLPLLLPLLLSLLLPLLLLLWSLVESWLESWLDADALVDDRLIVAGPAEMVSVESLLSAAGEE
ncbi:hypothetical protein GGR56DRAFT_628551 [Xylariaceae sp. FL0804]|nr:hypothetical protein GGR56DRAFT_628551 [Xylariaceae sp. FL0804]